MAKNAFDIFIPISVESLARRNIISDFFDLLAAFAANGKTNGLGGRKLSRLAGWWAFEHADTDTGFDGGYKSWASAADASSHLFFAFLRSRAPDDTAGSSGISQLPRSLLALLSQTEYPPEIPSLLHRATAKVVMIVERVSPTPYALLQRANTFDYQEVGKDAEPVLVRFGDCEDAVEALTFESRRVLDAISSTNASANESVLNTFGQPALHSSWSRFEDIGFSTVLDGQQEGHSGIRGYNSADGMRTKPTSGRNEFNRPTTPSWADFLSSGFTDDPAKTGPTNMLTLPPDQVLPPITPARVQSSQSHVRHGMKSDNLDPPELNATSHMDLDETFWWVWMSSLAGEEPPERKSVFGRCAFVETEPKVTGGGWLVLEEQVKGAAAPLKKDVRIVEKKSRFTFGRKSRQRRGSAGRNPPAPKFDGAKAASTPALARNQPTPEQESRVHQAAQELVSRQQEEDEEKSEHSARSGKRAEDRASRTQSVLTLGTPMALGLHKDAGPAMQWQRKFDKDSLRERYLGDPNFGLGNPRAPSMASTMDLISATKPDVDYDSSEERQLPRTPQAEDLPANTTVFEQPKQLTSTGLPQASSPLQDEAPVSPATPRASESKHRHKLSEKSTVSPDDLNHTARKPVGATEKPGRNQDHPAFRKPMEQTRTNGSPTPPMPAAAAATAAMKNSSARQGQQIDQQGLQKSKVGSTRKFKNLFTRKKTDEDDDVPEALRMQRAISARNKPANTLKKPPPVPKKEVVSAPTSEERYVEQQPVSSAPEAELDGEPGPEVETEQPTRVDDDAPAYGDSHATDSDPGNRSTAHFSNFTQGPLEDQPAFAGENEDDQCGNDKGDVTPEAHPGSQGFQTQAAERLFPQDFSQPQQSEFATPMEVSPDSEANHRLADNSLDHQQVPPPPSAPAPVPQEVSQDRWAQIRKNAAERRSDDQAVHGSRASQSNATEKTDDGETSGEECE